MDLHGPVLRALDAAGLTGAPPEPLVALLRGHVSDTPTSTHIANHAKARVQERAKDPETFAALHDELRAHGFRELDRLTAFLKSVADEKAVVQMLRMDADAKASDAACASGTAHQLASLDKGGDHGANPSARQEFVRADSASERPASAPTTLRAVSASSTAGLRPWESAWLVGRPYLNGGYLANGVRERLAGAAGSASDHSLAALPVSQQEQLLVTDLLCVLVGVEGVHLRAGDTQASALDDGASAKGGPPHSHPNVLSERTQFRLPSTPPPLAKSSLGGPAGVDPSLRELVNRLLPLGEHYVALSRFTHARTSSLESGLVMHAFCAAVR